MRALRFHRLFLAGVLAGLALSSGCQDHVSDTPIGGQPPRTFLWLQPDSTIATGVSRQTLRWWGEDPDGVVTGFLFGFSIVTGNVTSLPVPDTLRYTWVGRNDTTLLFPMDTVFRKFMVAVRAVDNTFPLVPGLTTVRLTPVPYWDKNDNGVLDGEDQQLSGLAAAVDPKGAVLTFPVRNTPPTIRAAQNPNDPSIVLKQPDTTYTVATFSWIASDPDGNNTLKSYRIALNDTSDPARWVTIPLRDTVVTLVVPRSRSDAAGSEVVADLYAGSFLGRQLIGQIPGLRLDALNKFFVEVMDVAGEYSPPLVFPSGTDRWFVRRPTGRVLLVSDYIGSDSAAAVGTYLGTLPQALGGGPTLVDQLNIGRGLSANEKSAGKFGPYVPPFVDPALIQTFLLYDFVVWYTDQFPSLGVAQRSLFTYMQNGGNVIFSTTFQSSVDPRGALRDFAPIDSVSTVPFTPRPAPGDTRIPGNYKVFPDSGDLGNLYPQLAFNTPVPPATFYLVFMRPIYRRTDARYIYHLQADTLNSPPRYIGTPNVAVVDGAKTIVFVGLPLHLLNNTVYGNPAGLSAFFSKVFNSEFNPAHRVNRMKF